MRRVQLQGGERCGTPRRTPCTFSSEGGFAPLPNPPPRNRCAGKAGARKRNTSTSGGEQRISVHTTQRWVFRFERGLRPRNRFLGEVSEGATEAPSDRTPQMGPYHRSSRQDHYQEDTMTRMTGGEALVKSLYREGVRVVFGLPGVQLYGVLAALRDEPGIRFIAT